MSQPTSPPLPPFSPSPFPSESSEDSLRPFPVPLVAASENQTKAPGEAPEYLTMPQDMARFSAPRLPESTEKATLAAVVERLRRLLSRMQAAGFAKARDITEDLRLWPDAERALVGDLLGFGEVSAYTMTRPVCYRVQETAFPALWRVLTLEVDAAGGETIREDALQAGAIPQILEQTMREYGQAEIPLPTFSDGCMNAPSLAREILWCAKNWQQDEGNAAAHVINLTLLPVTEKDLDALYEWLGHREVSILSRGYGNCRISSTRLSHVWWVQYFNSMDALILNTLEITAMPEAALAAREDFADTLLRLESHLESLEA